SVQGRFSATQARPFKQGDHAATTLVAPEEMAEFVDLRPFIVVVEKMELREGKVAVPSVCHARIRQSIASQSRGRDSDAALLIYRGVCQEKGFVSLVEFILERPPIVGKSILGLHTAECTQHDYVQDAGGKHPIACEAWVP